MGAGIKFRFAVFVLAIALMVAVIVWAAHTSWRRTGELRERLTAVQLQSFQIASHFQRTILGLNNTVLRYGVNHDAGDWSQFDRVSKELDRWIDEQRPMLSSEKEKQILDKINAAYDDYMAAARQIEQKNSHSAPLTTPWIEFTDFEKQSENILNLGLELANAHRESMDAFLADSKSSITRLEFLLMTSLALLLALGSGLAFVVYRELIAPLRVRLVESQQLAERHEKLASLGMLAAGVAHEIRNPLTAIKAWLFIQQKHLQPGTPERADLDVIGSEISRLERIVKEFLLFARPSEPQLATVPADQPLREVQTLLSLQLEKANIRLELEESPPALIKIDLEQIKQVLINLIQNAADSIAQNGTVTLRAQLDSKRLSNRTTDVVILEVADTGKGIPPEVEKRLFDPFFTTKPSGTGLGLSIAAGIMEKHGGALQYQTQVSRGTTFGIVLPRA